MGLFSSDPLYNLNSFSLISPTWNGFFGGSAGSLNCEETNRAETTGGLLQSCGETNMEVTVR